MKRTGHTHYCRCGTKLTCGYDRCAATSSVFVCAACEADAMDDYINDLQARILTESTTQPVTKRHTKDSITS